MGLDSFYEKTFGAHADLGRISAEERKAYLDEWRRDGALTAMLNWYRANEIEVPELGEKASAPIWTKLPFPHVKMPTLVIWAMKDRALLPIQLDGLHELVDDLRILTVADAGHFVPWEQPEPVIEAIRDFIAETPQLRDQEQAPV